MSDIITLEPGARFEDFKAFVAQGSWTDIEWFDKGRKSLAAFYLEYESGEIVVKYNPISGWIERHAENVKIRFVTHVLRQLYLCEVARLYPSGKHAWHPAPRDWTLRETKLPWEKTDKECALRCLSQEPKKFFAEHKVVPTEKDLHVHPGYRQRLKYESSAYLGVESHTKSRWYDLYLDLLIGEEETAKIEFLVLRDTDGKPETATNWVDIMTQPRHIAQGNWKEILERFNQAKSNS